MIKVYTNVIKILIEDCILKLYFTLSSISLIILNK